METSIIYKDESYAIMGACFRIFVYFVYFVV